MGTVSVKVHLCLLQVQTRVIANNPAFLHNAQAFFRKCHGIIQVVHTYALLHKVIVLSHEVGHIVFNGQSGLRFALCLEFAQTLIVGLYFVTIEQCPFGKHAHTGLMSHLSAFAHHSRRLRMGVSAVECGIVIASRCNRRQIAGIGFGGIVGRAFSLVAHHAQ